MPTYFKTQNGQISKLDVSLSKLSKKKEVNIKIPKITEENESVVNLLIKKIPDLDSFITKVY